MKRQFLPVVSILGAVWAQCATAQPKPDELQVSATVVVTGAAPEQAETFVKEVMPDGWATASRGVPRWNTELCISVIGPPAEQGQFIVDRISQRAINAGLQAGGPGCDTNLLIIVTNEPKTLLPAVSKKHRALFGFTGDANVDTGGSSSMADFLTDSMPVRWRQVIQTVSSDGMPLDGDPEADAFGDTQGYGGVAPPGNLPVVRADSTRLRSAVRRQLSRVVAVVDTTQTAGIGLGAISDYLAFVALADVSSKADLSDFPSILNLFNPDAARQARMTEWDMAFLDSLYSARLNAASGTAQYREIADRMVRERKE